MENFVFYITKGNDIVNRAKFLKHMKKFSLQERILDFSTPKTIRKNIMVELLQEIPKKPSENKIKIS